MPTNEQVRAAVENDLATVLRNSGTWYVDVGGQDASVRWSGLDGTASVPNGEEEPHEVRLRVRVEIA